MITEFVEFDYHRNGVGGEPFYVTTFRTDDNDTGLMVATVFVERDDDGKIITEWAKRTRNPAIAVLDIDRLPSVKFGHNSWRGDRYVDQIEHAIIAVEASPDMDKWTEIANESLGNE